MRVWKRGRFWIGMHLGLAAFGAVLVQAGCWSDYDSLYLPLTNPELGRDGGADGAEGAGGSAPSCAGDPTQDPAIVNDNCGVFVSASAAPGGDGKEARPFQTF